MLSRAILAFVATVATLTTAVTAAGGHAHGAGTAGFEWAGNFPGTCFAATMYRAHSCTLPWQFR